MIIPDDAGENWPLHQRNAGGGPHGNSRLSPGQISMGTTTTPSNWHKLSRKTAEETHVM